MHRPRIGLVAAVLVAVATAACSSDGAGNGDGDGSQPAAAQGRETTTSTDGTTDPEAEANADADAVAFAECMREHGIDYPDPVLGPDGEYAFEDPGLEQVPPDDLDAAMGACRDLLPPQTAIDDPASLAAWLDAAVEWAECMRERGHPVPDPQLSDESEVGAVEVNPGDRSDPAFAAAAAECDEALRDAERDIREDAAG